MKLVELTGLTYVTEVLVVTKIGDGMQQYDKREYYW